MPLEVVGDSLQLLAHVLRGAAKDEEVARVAGAHDRGWVARELAAAMAVKDQVLGREAGSAQG
eukprot:8714337-Pyramimonas_sp.AAC.1